MIDGEPKAELVAELRIAREPGYLYFVRENQVRRIRVAKGAPEEVVATFEAAPDPSYLYLLDRNGDVARALKSTAAKSNGGREAVYCDLWGPAEKVAHEILPREPHIDVLVHPPRQDGRDFYTLVTSGMSDLRLASEPPAPKRVEMVMYVHEPRE